jgi:hypothetical protein
MGAAARLVHPGDLVIVISYASLDDAEARTGGPNDVSTPAGIRKPDVFVVPKDVARRDQPPGAHLLRIRPAARRRGDVSVQRAVDDQERWVRGLGSPERDGEQRSATASREVQRSPGPPTRPGRRSRPGPGRGPNSPGGRARAGRLGTVGPDNGPPKRVRGKLPDPGDLVGLGTRLQKIPGTACAGAGQPAPAQDSRLSRPSAFPTRSPSRRCAWR